MRMNLIKFMYNAMLAGMPSITYNPINRNNFVVPVIVHKYSTYANFKLGFTQIRKLNKYLKEFNSDLQLVPITLYSDDVRDNYYLSINYYNCSTPIMSYKNIVSRLEINTYIKNKKTGEYGTVILDYVSDTLSMDPINYFKKQENLKFMQSKSKEIVCHASSKNDLILMDSDFTTTNKDNIKLSEKLMEYTDKVFYKNGIYEKLYYDSKLRNSKIYKVNENKFNIEYRDLHLKKPDSIFYFSEELNFVGSIWDNVYADDY